MHKIAAEQPVSAVSTLAADAAANLSLSVSERPTNLRRMSPSMRRSVPTLASGRHMSSPSAPGHPFGGRQSSSFKDSRANSANSSHSVSSVDTRHIKLFMEKRDSKSSIHSGSTMGDTSRPLSAGSGDSSSPRQRVGSSASHLTTDGTDGSTTTVTVHHVAVKANKANTRIVAPNNPLGGRPMPPPLKKQNTVPDLRRPRSHYVGELVWEIDETVYCGGLEAAYNLNLLCRLNIEYIVDLSGLDEDNMPRSQAKRGDCPCLCSRPTAHSRALMAINVDEHTTQDLVPYFRDVNAFIDKAKAVKKCVLVHCQFGKNLAPAFVSSYLMRSQKMSRLNAVEMVMSLCPNVSIDENIHKSLRKWEAVVGVSEGVMHSDEDSSNRLSVPQFKAKRAAWT